MKFQRTATVASVLLTHCLQVASLHRAHGSVLYLQSLLRLLGHSMQCVGLNFPCHLWHLQNRHPPISLTARTLLACTRGILWVQRIINIQWADLIGWGQATVHCLVFGEPRITWPKPPHTQSSRTLAGGAISQTPGALTDPDLMIYLTRNVTDILNSSYCNSTQWIHGGTVGFGPFGPADRAKYNL